MCMSVILPVKRPIAAARQRQRTRRSPLHPARHRAPTSLSGAPMATRARALRYRPARRGLASPATTTPSGSTPMPHQSSMHSAQSTAPVNGLIARLCPLRVLQRSNALHFHTSRVNLKVRVSRLCEQRTVATAPPRGSRCSNT